jgi:hypothetical protein
MQVSIRNQMPGLLGLILGFLTSCTIQREISPLLPHTGSIPTPNITPQTVAAQTKMPQKTRLAVRYGQLPLHFEPNQGQSDSRVKFLSRGQGYHLYLTPTEAVLALRKNGGNGETGKR